MKMKPDKSELLARIRAIQKELEVMLDMVIALDDPHDVPEAKILHSDDDEWLTVREVCSRMGISQSTFYEAVKNGILPPGFAVTPRNRRWRISDIRAWQSKQNCNDTDERQHTHKRRGRVSRVRKINEFCRSERR